MRDWLDLECNSYGWEEIDWGKGGDFDPWFVNKDSPLGELWDPKTGKRGVGGAWGYGLVRHRRRHSCLGE